MNPLRCTLAALLSLVTAVVVLAGASGDDLKAMQGQWQGNITEIDGKPASAEEMNLKFVLVIEGDRYRVLHNGKPVAAGTIKLDAAMKPRTIDTTHTEGPFKGVVQKGIYAIEGDTMTVTVAKPGKERPTAFKTTAGSDHSVVRYVRMKQ